jgi:hypothetical protein
MLVVLLIMGRSGREEGGGRDFGGAGAGIGLDFNQHNINETSKSRNQSIEMAGCRGSKFDQQRHKTTTKVK